MNFLDLYKHLLPRAKAWSITAIKQLRDFFIGLSGIPEDVKLFFDKIWEDIFPGTTRELDKWEKQFNLSNSALSDAERRTALDAAWKALGGQDPRYIQDSLQAAGFPVYIHEWWVPGTEPAVGVPGCATPRNPLLYVSAEYTESYPGVDCGEPLAACGEEFAEDGNFLEGDGSLLVNKIGFTGSYKRYTVPPDSTKWPYFLYIGDENFGDKASVPLSRREEFETLCLKICPTQQWLVLMVDYI